jgi:hypothetical protein
MPWAMNCEICDVYSETPICPDCITYAHESAGIFDIWDDYPYDEMLDIESGLDKEGLPQ